MTNEQSVLETLEQYARAYCAKDIDGLMAVFDNNEDISLIGTGAEELCVGRMQVADVFLRNFADATAHQFEWHWRHVIITGDSAVVAATLTIHLTMNGESLTVPVRWTVSLVCRDQGWKWLHRHASVAAGGQADGAAYPTDQ